MGWPTCLPLPAFLTALASPPDPRGSWRSSWFAQPLAGPHVRRTLMVWRRLPEGAQCPKPQQTPRGAQKILSLRLDSPC